MIKGIGVPNKLIRKKEGLFGAYMSKEAAFGALLSEIDKPFNDDINELFPITGTISEITETTRKGDPKKVRISIGNNQGITKGLRFRINDNSRPKADYDLEVDEPSNDNSICKVNSNESFIADKMKSEGKISITTSLDPQNNYDIETYENKNALNSDIRSKIDGTWHGEVTQKGYKNPYSIQFTCNSKYNEFKVNYPANGCSGIWEIEKVSESTIDFREAILNGQTVCASGGLVSVKIINDRQVEMDFYMPKSSKLIAHGTATKE